MTAVDPGPNPAALASSAAAAPAGPAWSLPVATPSTGRRRVLLPIGAGVLTAVATAYTWRVDPNTSHAFPLCPLRYLTHLDCPMCGALRAVHSLTHGDIVGAVDHNLLFVVMVPFLVVGYLWWLGHDLGFATPPVHISRRVVVGVVGTCIVFAIARNLPIPGHDLLNSTSHLAGRRS